MNRRLLARTALGLVAALTLAAAGCAEDTNTPGAGPGTGDQTTTSGDAAAEVAAAVQALGETTFKVETTMGLMMSGSGAVDPQAGIGTMQLGLAMGGMDVEIIYTESDLWLRMGSFGDMIGVGDGWLHLDPARLGSDGFLGIKPGQQDPANTRSMLDAMVEVEKVDDRTYRGKIDLTKVEDSAIANQDTVDALGDTATELEFTLTLDDQGRLVKYVMDLPASDQLPAQTIETTYSDFGAPVTITAPPADEVTDATDLVYQMFELGTA